MKIPYLVKRQQLSWIAVGFLTISFMVTGYSILYGYVTDNVIHPPPTTGTYAYNTFKPGAVGFPAVGGTYVDPVFGGIVRRLTNVVGEINCDDIYSHHWANSNGTYAFTKRASAGICGTLIVINTVTGADTYTSQPEGLNASELNWSPTDPDKYYYFSGADLVRRNLAAQTNTTMKTFPATLEALGGSENWLDGSGRYFVVRYSGQVHVWDSQTNTIYAGAFTPINVSGYVGITPDGNYVFDVAGTGADSPQIKHHSHLLNHGTQTVESAVQFWGLCGDHGSFSSASNGKNYMITGACHSVSGIYRVDITLNQAGRTEVQQLADNQLLIYVGFGNGAHFSSVSKGPLTNWAFISQETFADVFDGTTAGWQAYEQEIIAVNVVTLEIRRIAHHRSRDLTSYAYFPRVSCSSDGSVVLWTSNFNISGHVGYADLYAISFSTSSNVTAPSIPQNLRVK